MKRCSMCGVEKSASEFRLNRSQAGGLQSRCKPCQIAGNREWARRNTHITKATRRRKRLRHLDRYHARQAVYKATRRGKLTRPAACSNCGVPCKPHGHHQDYSKRLDVKWLCTRCHCELHQGISV